jgi:hypothetical protein
MIGSRDPDKPELREWLAGEGGGIQSGTFAETASHGELLVLALLGTAAEQAIADAGAEKFSGKVVIDAMNPLDFSGGFPPKLSITGEDSLGERVQRALPEAKVVKAFNSIGNAYFVDPSFAEGKSTMLIAKNDESASSSGSARQRRRLADLCDLAPQRIGHSGALELAPQLEETATERLRRVRDDRNLHASLAAAPEARQVRTSKYTAATPTTPPPATSSG